MGCHQSPQQVANSANLVKIDEKMTKVFVEIDYGKSCGWVKPVFKLYKKLSSLIPHLPIDCRQ